MMISASTEEWRKGPVRVLSGVADSMNQRSLATEALVALEMGDEPIPSRS